MCNNKRIVTSGVERPVPNYLQNILWYMIEIMEVSKKDRLQAFELVQAELNGEPAQKIIHSQEHPAYRKEHVIPVKNPVTAKVLVTDESNYSKMLLADEH